MHQAPQAPQEAKAPQETKATHPPQEAKAHKEIRAYRASSYGVWEIQALKFAPNCPVVQTLWEGMSPREFIYSIALFTQERSTLTGDLVFDSSERMEREQSQVYLKHRCDTMLDRSIRDVFTFREVSGTQVRTLNRINLRALITDDDPFFNEEFDPEVYTISAKGSLSKSFGIKKRSIQSMLYDTLIKTTVRQLVKKESFINFDGSGVEYITGEWIQQVDLNTCDKETRDQHVLAHMRWFDTHRMHRISAGPFTLSDFANAATMFKPAAGLVVID